MNELHDLILKSKNLKLLLEYKKKFRKCFNLTRSPVVIENILTDADLRVAVEYFMNSKCYCAHVPRYANHSMQKPNFNAHDTPYLSYKIECSLRSKEIRKIINNKKISKIIQEELGAGNIYLYSVNTFWTVPGTGHFTHKYHRDEDGLNFITVFVNLTSTENGDGHFEYITDSGHPEELLQILKKKKIEPNAYYNINANSTNGYYSNEYYELIFGSPSKISLKAGSCCLADTWGLHSGSLVKKPRLVTWLRYATHANTAYFHDENRLEIEEFNDFTKELKNELINNPVYELLLPYGVTE